MKYLQLQLTGEINDYSDCLNMINGYTEFVTALAKFYRINCDVNPRQLHYIVASESTAIHLDALIDNK